MKTLSRRELLKMSASLGLGAFFSPFLSILEHNRQMLKRAIPSSGEMIPAVGLGTWIQFDVGSSDSERDPLRKVLELMVKQGGKVIDSSPMYGNAEEVVGDLTVDIGHPDHFFYATKVWTRGRESGINQMNASMRKMRRETMDLIQVHNLVDWQTHLATLDEWKEEGKIRYKGVTHYTDASHDDLEEIIRGRDIDFVQFNYSIRERNAEKSLLDAAMDNDVAVLINQPYGGGSLFQAVSGKALPGWASEYDISSWGQFFLKYILSHPAVTCVIPGTSDPEHLVDNMGAGYGKMPDEKTRKEMLRYFNNL